MKSIPATYENGVFKPQSPVDLPQGARVDLLVSEPQDDPVAVLKTRFPNSFGIMPREDADEMQRIIDEEFGKVNPDDWR